MRYLGNKTKLLPFIVETVARLADGPGVACDPFAGTASVSTALKRAGWQVHAGDLMSASYALQIARVALDEPPEFSPGLLPGAGNGARTASYRELLSGLGQLQGQGFFSEHYTTPRDAAGSHGRMYFSPENGRRIDAIRTRIETWEQDGSVDHASGQFLIATLIEAADRVANTTGVYASFVKTLQPNARHALELRPIETTPRPLGAAASTAFRGPACERLRGVGPVDLIYLDPPYNGRQYPGYYHIPELLALGWSTPPRIRGKTGLIPDDDLRSDWCRKKAVGPALDKILDAADGRIIMFSYNDEGLLKREEIEAALRERGIADTYHRYRKRYRRYRSDSDGPRRTYVRDRVEEQLHCVRCS